MQDPARDNNGWIVKVGNNQNHNRRDVMSNLMMPSRVLLYGRALKGLKLDVSKLIKGRGYNLFLYEQFAKKSGKAKNSKFALIYGFEFEGHYYDLLVPTILLVHGKGINRKNAKRVEKPDPKINKNIRIWPYDKADFSMRLDPSSGPIESILLEAELDDAELSDEMAGRKVSGRKVGGYLGRGRKVSGRKVGISGRKVRGD